VGMGLCRRCRWVTPRPGLGSTRPRKASGVSAVRAGAGEKGRATQALLQGRVAVDVGGVDKIGRLLARVELSDGRDLGSVLVQEHLAKPYQEGSGPTGVKSCHPDTRASV
jgi:hypothetical protein